ncbi:MAG: LL-diaminopimelate aminotransferase [Planctomycetota bacterium]|jgi:LL-diaminopimelate aminotransferase
MALINEHFLKLSGGYLFPEIGRRVRAFVQEHRDAGQRLIHCGIGDVTEPLPEVVRQAMHDAIDELGRHDTFRGYGDPQGYLFLREAIVEHDFAARGLSIDPDEVFVSDGSKTDCGAILDVLAGDGRNRVGVADPVYPVYVDTNVMAGNTGEARDGGYDGIHYLPCTADNGFVPELPAEPLDVIYLCYPNNPTGGMIDRARLEAWVEYALRHDAIILYDVAYRAFITDASAPRSIFEVDGAERCAIEFHSFSKSAGFTGVRCGYTVCPKAVRGRTAGGDAVELHPLWTRRWHTKSNGVSYPVQRGAAAVYTDAGQEQVAELVGRYLGNARILVDGCHELGLSVCGGVNSPYVWATCPEGLDSWAMFDLMLTEANVVITPGAGFGRCGEGYFRISAFNSRSNVQEVVRRLETLKKEAV